MRSIIAWIDSKFLLKAGLLPLLATAPPVYLANVKWDHSSELYLQTHPYLRLVLVGWPIVVLTVAMLYEKFKPSNPISATEWECLLMVLRRIVGAKVDRFTAAKQQLSQADDSRAKKIFNTITRPDEQMEIIVSGIYQFFEATRPEKIPAADLGIRVALARMGVQHIEQFTCFFPPGSKPRSSIASLQTEDACFSRAKAQKGIVIVEDFIKENTAGPGRRFTVTDNSRRSEGGSMICFPILVRGTEEVPYVISVCSKKSKYFKTEDENYYSKILEHFEQRITMEYCLKELKEIAK